MGDGGAGKKLGEREREREERGRVKITLLILHCRWVATSLARGRRGSGMTYNDMPGVVHKVFLGIYQRLRDCWHFWLMHALALGSLLGEKREGFGFESSPQLNCAVVFPRAAISN